MGKTAERLLDEYDEAQTYGPNIEMIDKKRRAVLAAMKRANRLTKAERTVVKASVEMLAAEGDLKRFEGKYQAWKSAVRNLERAKGGAR